MKEIIVEIILFVDTVIIASLTIVTTIYKGVLVGGIFLALLGAFGSAVNRISGSEKNR